MSLTQFLDLHAHQQEALRAWRQNYLHPEQPVGLWVYGGRNSGSTTVAHIALSKAVSDGLVRWEEVSALRLVDMTRERWSAADMARNMPSDYDLYVESNQSIDAVDNLWDLDVLVVDDLHEEAIDVSFWRKHVQPRIEARLKTGGVTIVATDMAPSHRALTGLQGAIEKLFVTCYAER